MSSTIMFHECVFVVSIYVIYVGITTANPIYPGGGFKHNLTNSILPDKTSCRTSVPLLDDEQIAKLRLAMGDQIFLDKLERVQNGVVNIMSQELQRPLISFSAIQKRNILRKYRELFLKKPDFRGFQQQRRSLTDSTTDNSEIRIPQDLQAGPVEVNAGHRVCPPIQSYKSLVISFDENNNPVQVVQFPEDDAQQWFMEESCQYETSPVSSASCSVTDRLVNAYIVNLTSDPPGEIHMGMIRVHSCVGFV